MTLQSFWDGAESEARVVSVHTKWVGASMHVSVSRMCTPACISSHTPACSGVHLHVPVCMGVCALLEGLDAWKMNIWDDAKAGYHKQ